MTLMGKYVQWSGVANTAEKMKFCITHFFSKCEKILYIIYTKIYTKYSNNSNNVYQNAPTAAYFLSDDIVLLVTTNNFLVFFVFPGVSKTLWDDQSWKQMCYDILWL